MKLRRAVVSGYRTLREPVEITFGDGLNVIHAPNETGKSTLMHAVWDALSQRARVGGQTQKAMVPLQGGVPNVLVEFSHGGSDWTVRKSFTVSTGTAALERRGADGRVETWDGDAAEERLRELLGVAKPNNRGVIGDAGLWPLVWVRQGESGVTPTSALGAAGRASLSAVLAEMIGEVFAGAGAKQLFERVQHEYERYFTSSGGESRASSSPLASAREAASVAAEEHRELAERLAEHERSLERRERLGARRQRLREQVPVLRERLQTAEADRASLGSLREAVRQADAALAVARAEHDAAAQLQSIRSESIRRLSTMQGEQSELTRKRKEAVELQAEHGAGHAERVAAEEAARSTAEERRRAVERLQAAFDLARVQRDLERARVDHERVTGLHARRARAAAELATIRVDASQLRALRDAATELRDARMRLDAVSTELVVEALADLELRVDGVAETLASGSEQTLQASGALELEVPGTVRVRVTPGQQGVAERRTGLATTQRVLAERLSAAGVADIEAAEAAAQRRADLVREMTSCDEQLAALPSAVSEEAVGRLEQECAAAASRLQEVGGAALEADAADDVRAALADATAAHADASQRAEAAAEQRLAHERESERLVAAVLVATRREQDRQTELERAARWLDTHRAEHGGDDVLSERVSAQAEARERASSSSEALREQLASLQPDAVETAWQRAGQALKASDDELATLEREIAQLDGELMSLQVVGLHERVTAAAARVESTSGELARQERDAATAKLLFETLRAARDAAQSRHLEPLMERVRRLLPLWDPQASLVFDEGLTMVQLDRGSGVGVLGFDQLSAGAREQLGVLVRIAFAQLLGEGEGMPVILDDALVATDEGRFERMLGVLHGAARDVQIVLLTSHWDRLRGLGLAPDRSIDLEAAIAVRGV